MYVRRSGMGGVFKEQMYRDCLSERNADAVRRGIILILIDSEMSSVAGLSCSLACGNDANAVPTVGP